MVIGTHLALTGELSWTVGFASLIPFFLVSDPFQNKRIGVPCPRFQINNFASTYAQAKAMADLTYQALDGFYGVMGGSGGIMVEGAIYQEMSDFFEPDTKLYNVMIDFVILYHESL